MRLRSSTGHFEAAQMDYRGEWKQWQEVATFNQGWRYGCDNENISERSDSKDVLEVGLTGLGKQLDGAAESTMEDYKGCSLWVAVQ